MGKAGLIAVIIAGFVAGAGEVRAEDEQAPAMATVAAESAPPAGAPPAPAKPPKPPTPEERLLAVIEGTSWPVELSPMGGEGKPVKDTISFAGRQVTSKHLEESGYLTSNFTLTIGGDGVPVWETMQTNEGVGVAFWRGEFHGDSMRGILSKQLKEGVTQDFSFTGREASGRRVEAGAVAPAAGSSGSAAAPATAPAGGATGTPPVAETKSKSKKKRGWF